MFKKKKHSPKRLQTEEVSPINKSKIYALADIYNQLPSNSFSKLTVTLCFIGIFGIIIASFVFLFLGFDPTGIAQCGLLAFTAELFILGARTLFSKEQTENDIIFDQIRHDINDGNYYNENGKILFTELNKENINEDEISNEQDKVYINNDIDKEFQVSTEEDLKDKLSSIQTSISVPKKRGRPKKQIKTENIIVQKNVQNQDSIDFGSADKDGRD